jgi:outer membrane biosynthesis protein TonB
VAAELNLAAAGKKMVTEDHVQRLIVFIDRLKKKNGDDVSAFEEVVRLGSLHHLDIFNDLLHLVEEGNIPPGTVADVFGPGTCFLPMIGSGKLKDGGFLPATAFCTAINKFTKADEWIAMMRRAFARWLLTGGVFCSEKEWSWMADDEGKWQEAQAEDYLTLAEWSKSIPLDSTGRGILEPLEVLVFAGHRQAAQNCLDSFCRDFPTTEFATSQAALAGFTAAALPVPAAPPSPVGGVSDAHVSEDSDSSQVEPSNEKEGDEEEEEQEGDEEEEEQEGSGDEEEEEKTDEDKEIEHGGEEKSKKQSKKKKSKKKVKASKEKAKASKKKAKKAKKASKKKATGRMAVLPSATESLRRFRVDVKDVTEMLRQLASGKTTYQSWKEKVAPPTDMCSPALVFMAVHTNPKLALSTQQRAVTNFLRLAESAVAAISSAGVKNLFAFSCSEQWHVYYLGNLILSKGWYTPPALTGRVGTATIYIVLATVTQNAWTVLEASLGGVGEEASEAEWLGLFENASPTMFGSDIPFADGEFPPAVLVTAWLVKFFTSEGDVVWELCEDNRPHVSLAAIALGRRAFVVVAEDKAEKAQTRLQAVQDYHNAPTKWNMYHNPAKILTIIALAEVTEFSNGEFSSAYFLKSQFALNKIHYAEGDEQPHTAACENAWLNHENADDDSNGASTAGMLAVIPETYRFSIQASALEQRSGESPGLGVISPRSGLNEGDDLCSVQ